MAEIFPPAYGAVGDTLPIVDTTAVVKGSADVTKLVRIEADGLTTATTRVITMADQDIDLTPDTGTFAAAGGGGAGLVFLSSVTASASATVDIETTFDSTFDAYLIVGVDIIVATDAVILQSRMKVGGSYDTGANYRFHTHRMDSFGTTYIAASGNASTSLSIVLDTGNTAGRSLQFQMTIMGVDNTTLIKKLHWTGNSVNSGGNSEALVGGGVNNATTALTGVRFFASSGNITSGTFRLYGIVNS